MHIRRVKTGRFACFLVMFLITTLIAAPSEARRAKDLHQSIHKLGLDPEEITRPC